jgi:hypothetical protein
VDHDRLFKELLAPFLVEFLELFLPQVLDYLDRDSIEFLDKELFTDVTAGDRHEVDLIAKARFRGQPTCFLLHVELQASAMGDFPRRMFRYFARLHERHGMPVYPIALFSYDEPLRAEPSTYELAFPDKKVLQFNYEVIQLNRLDWRKYARRPNPVASALMAKMQIDPQDRPKVKLECIRLLATLRLDPARMQLIRGFVNSYLPLTPAEERQFDKDLEAMEPMEKQQTMQVLDRWEEKGRQEGLAQGMREIVAYQLRQRVGEVPKPLADEIDGLSPARLREFAGALMGFTSIGDAQAWMAAHS